MGRCEEEEDVSSGSGRWVRGVDMWESQGGSWETRLLVFVLVVYCSFPNIARRDANQSHCRNLWLLTIVVSGTGLGFADHRPPRPC